MEVQNKPYLRCKKCGDPYHYPLKKNALERLLSLVISFRKFFCARCLKARLVFISDEEYSKYRKVI
jgi:DNA-directed RNA polymerase subunit RPC12/RpoP